MNVRSCDNQVIAGQSGNGDVLLDPGVLAGSNIRNA
jgi:hypothetical protein